MSASRPVLMAVVGGVLLLLLFAVVSLGVLRPALRV